MKSATGKIGIWIIGARGGLATTLIAGTHMLARKLVDTSGLITCSAEFSKLKLPQFGRFVFGGHDVRHTPLWESALAIQATTHSFPGESLKAIRSKLKSSDANIRPGMTLNCGPAIQALREPTATLHGKPDGVLRQLRKDLQEFRKQHRLERVFVVNAASTEPPLPRAPFRKSGEGLLQAIKANDKRLRACELYGAAAALECDGIINFTPNEGMLSPAVCGLAEARGVVFMGHDGKTGETLVKSALAPMFRYRNLKILSWLGYNILGDRDGQVLADPLHRASKIRNKDGILQRILGYAPTSIVRIDYVPSLEDNKTAWDFVHFEGFLGHRMSLQFTWAGTDSILAAPLVLDMVRMASLACDRGERGRMEHLSVFFKAPLGVGEDDLHVQFHRLTDYVRSAAAQD
ncbi:MAG: myo-inositol-1-phosphate synthase [Planctomycetes bacterium]|nr:myo-inositol-1-phosphate synthase [Planctomycetota bacterium]